MADENLAWAITRVDTLLTTTEWEAGRYGEKLLRGYGYPNETMSLALDALALRIVLDAARTHPLDVETANDELQEVATKHAAAIPSEVLRAIALLDIVVNGP